MEPYRILSLDGGGIRGILTARILERLAALRPRFLDTIDLFAGTSTGAIISLGLAAGLAPGQLVNLYRENSAAIFADTCLDDLLDLRGLAGADYSNRQLKEILQRTFGELGLARLGDLTPRVLIPAFDLDSGKEMGKTRRWKPKFFHNYPVADSDGAELIVEVALRASAAPTYFPTYGRFIDGGVVVNQPALSALAQALHPATGQQALGNVRLLSIGSGVNPTYIEGENLDWGYLRWARPIIRLMLEGGMDVVDYQCRQILGDAYHRLGCVMSEAIPLDRYERVGDLIAIADAVDLDTTLRWLDNVGF